jgi:hypothetical protein
VDSLLQGVSNAYAPKFDRSAIRTLRGEHGVSITSFLPVCFRRTASAASLVTPKCRRGLAHIGVAGAAQIRAASFPGGLDLFRCPQVRLGELNPFSGASNLALMPFC